MTWDKQVPGCFGTVISSFKLTYAAAIAGVIRYWWGVKTGVKTPLTITIVLGILLAARPLLALKRQRVALKAQSTVTT